MSILHRLRLTAAVVLVVAIFLPMSECSRHGDKNAIAPRQTFSQLAFPQSNEDFQYSYVISDVRLSTWQAGAFGLIALLWPLAACLFDRRVVRKRFGWTVYILELALGYGTIYWLTLFTAMGRRLYGAYIVIVAMAIFALATLVLLVSSIRGMKRLKASDPPG
jgi:hypothetical protein